jgi:hypothetical protein
MGGQAPEAAESQEPARNASTLSQTAQSHSLAPWSQLGSPFWKDGENATSPKPTGSAPPLPLSTPLPRAGLGMGGATQRLSDIFF